MANTSNTVLTTRNQGVNLARLFQQATSNTQACAYYVFVGDHLPLTTSSPEEANNSDKYSQSDVFRHMMFGKRVAANAVSVVARNIQYVANTVYDMYDDQLEDLYDSDFYVVTVDGTFQHVFKCLDNNLGNYSTIQPSFSDIVGSNTELYQTTDGYKWKYLYSFDQTANQMFASAAYIPVVPNTAVQTIAVRGAIDIIKIDDVGRGYDNYLTGTFNSSDLRINGDSTVYQLSNSVASSVNGFYTGCGLYLSTGTGAGQYRKVVDYISNANGNFAFVDSFFEVSPTNGTQYEIYPDVVVVGDGRQSINVTARALVNSYNSNSIFRVEVIERGATYTAASATVVANDVVDVIKDAQLRPILPPGFGHGYDPFAELGADKATIYVSIANSDSTTLPLTNQFKQIGIVKDPTFNNVVLGLQTGFLGSFLPGETIAKIQPIQVASGCVLNGSNVTSTSVDLRSPFAANAYIYLADGNTPTNKCIATINSVTNSTFLSLGANATFNSSNTLLYIVDPLTVGTALSYNGANTLTITNCVPIVLASDLIVGLSSSALATVNTVTRQAVMKTFDTFVNMTKYVGSVTFGSFIDNEYVNQGNLAAANAVLFSTFLDSGTMTMYTSNQSGLFVTGSQIAGNTSGALASFTAKYNPELISDSGNILYLENINPVPIDSDQTLTFKITLNF